MNAISKAALAYIESYGFSPDQLTKEEIAEVEEFSKEYSEYILKGKPIPVLDGPLAFKTAYGL